MKTCAYCNAKESSQFWHLSNYHGISATLCAKCYDLVSHDSYRRPENPVGFEQVRRYLELKSC